MPYGIRKLSKRNCYKVFNKKTKKVFSKCSSLKNANKQLRLLRAIQYNKDFTPLKNRSKKIKIKRII